MQKNQIYIKGNKDITYVPATKEMDAISNLMQKLKEKKRKTKRKPKRLEKDLTEENARHSKKAKKKSFQYNRTPDNLSSEYHAHLKPNSCSLYFSARNRFKIPSTSATFISIGDGPCTSFRSRPNDQQ